MKKIAGEAVYTADIYLRLSDDDGDKMESNSIKNCLLYTSPSPRDS